MTNGSISFAFTGDTTPPTVGAYCPPPVTPHSYMVGLYSGGVLVGSRVLMKSNDSAPSIRGDFGAGDTLSPGVYTVRVYSADGNTLIAEGPPVTVPYQASGGTAVAPAVTTSPTISGTAQVGSTLTLTDGVASGSPSPTVASRQWYWGDTNAPISGATGTTYTIVSGDTGHPIVGKVTWTNASGSAVGTSTATASVIAAASGGASFPAMTTPLIHYNSENVYSDSGFSNLITADNTQIVGIKDLVSGATDRNVTGTAAATMVYRTGGANGKPRIAMANPQTFVTPGGSVTWGSGATGNLTIAGVFRAAGSNTYTGQLLVGLRAVAGTGSADIRYQTGSDYLVTTRTPDGNGIPAPANGVLVKFIMRVDLTGGNILRNQAKFGTVMQAEGTKTLTAGAAAAPTQLILGGWTGQAAGSTVDLYDLQISGAYESNAWRDSYMSAADAYYGTA